MFIKKQRKVDKKSEKMDKNQLFFYFYDKFDKITIDKQNLKCYD